MSKSNEYRLGQRIPITEKGEIRIFREDHLIEVLKIQLRWPWVKKIIVLMLSLFGLAFVFVLVVNLTTLRALDLVTRIEESSSMVHLRWSYQNRPATFYIERQVKDAGGRWGTYSQIGHAVIKEDNYVFVDDTVDPNTTYRYRISMDVQSRFRVFIIRKKKIFISSEVLTLPLKPEDFIAASLSDHQVALRWQQPSGADRFEISRGENQADLERLEIPQSQIRQENGQYIYMDETVTSNTRYWYALVAWNQSGPSKQTDPIPVLTRPSPPADLRLEDANGRVRLSWSSPDSGNGLGFRIYSGQTDSDEGYIQIGDVPHNPENARQSFVHGISMDKQWYRVVAYNESGDSQPVILPPQPIVMRIQPNQGLEEDGTEVIIRGTGFVAGLTVQIGSNRAKEVAVTPIAIRVITPPGEGIQDVFVETIHGSFTLPGGFTYARGFVEIPAASVVQNAEVEIIVDGVQYSLGEERQQAPLTQTPPIIHITNGNGYEFRPLEENPAFFGDEPETLYIGYIELSHDYPEGWTVQVYRFPGMEPITGSYTTPNCNPIILLLRNETEVITVEVRNEAGQLAETMVAFEIGLAQPLLEGHW